MLIGVCSAGFSTTQLPAASAGASFEPKVDLAHALELREFGKNQRQSFTNPLIRILLDAVMTNLHVPYRDRHEEFAAPRFLLQGFD